MIDRPYAPTKNPHDARIFMNAHEAVVAVTDIYETNTRYLQNCLHAVARGEKLDEAPTAHYPYVALTTDSDPDVDTRLSFGFVRGASRYVTTLTRPDIFADYLEQQFEQLLSNHHVPLEVGVSTTPIPVHFAFGDGIYVEGELDGERITNMRKSFTLPDLSIIDDNIANGIKVSHGNEERPLSMFTAPRIDYSLHRLRHYTATDPIHFQKFVIFTNYQFYVDEFVRIAQDIMTKSDDPEVADYRRSYVSLIGPGNYTLHNQNRGDQPPTGTPAVRMPQMPAYHLTREDGCGITIVNIGVGPSNARNISDHIAVLRPHAWLTLGHCAGLRHTQKLGDYVLAHAYVRDDHVLDKELPLWVPVPALAEIQVALQTAIGIVTEKNEFESKAIVRTGTVVTTGDRNWEISGYEKLVERFSQSRAIALDMESAVIAANGFRFRVPYGSLLCISDKPLHGEIKLPGMANRFYEQQVKQHLQIGFKAFEILRSRGVERLHSRKLRSFDETAFR